MKPSGTMRLGDNLLSAYVYLAFSALVLLLLTPLYVRVLGAEAWGAVAWCLTVQGVLFGLDALLAPLLLRDVAQAPDHTETRAIYTRFLRLYGGGALLVFMPGQLLLLVPGVVEALPSHVAWGLRLALLQFLVQFSNNAAIGVWYGQRRQRFANLRLAGFAALKHVGALALVFGIEPSPAAFFLPFALVGAIEFVVNRRRVLHEATHGESIAAVVLPDAATGSQRDVAGFAFAASIGLLATHVDRIVLSLLLDPPTYGVYFLLGTLLLSLLHLQTPLGRVFLPDIATAASPRAAARSMLAISLPLLVLPCLAIAAWPVQVLQLWLHRPPTPEAAATLRILVLAAVPMVLFAPIGALLVRERRWRTLAALNLAMLSTQCLVLALLAPRLGMQAGAWAWLAGATLQLLCGLPAWRRARETTRA